MTTGHAIDPHTGLEVLERAECLELLRSHHLGRLAVVIGEHPVIFPVNYAIDGETIVFRTDEGAKLHGAVPDREVAFEIDGSDPLYHGGWSVLVVGRAEEIASPDERARLTGLPLGAWCPGPMAHWIRIRPAAVTGRRIPYRHRH